MNREIDVTSEQEEDWTWSPIRKSMLSGINGNQAFSG
jgi:hypothetical protein